MVILLLKNYASVNKCLSVSFRYICIQIAAEYSHSNEPLVPNTLWLLIKVCAYIAVEINVWRYREGES